MATEQIAEALAADRDALVTAAVQRYVKRIPGYRDGGARVAEDARRHTETHHDLLCAVLRRGRPPPAARASTSRWPTSSPPPGPTTRSCGRRCSRAASRRTRRWPRRAP